jgi:hypothetical protein
MAYPVGANKITVSPAAKWERCSWCSCQIIVGEIAADYPDGSVEHMECKQQRVDENALRAALAQCADYLAGVAVQYRATHPTRVREHHAGALLARIELTIAAAVR